MNVSNSSIPRYELKFIAEPKEYFRMLNWIRQHSSCFKTEYPERQVNNIYFDTYNYNSYCESIYGSSSKSKVRFRWYGSSNEPKSGSLEVKCKRNQLNWKLIYKVQKNLSRIWGRLARTMFENSSRTSARGKKMDGNVSPASIDQSI